MHIPAFPPKAEEWLPLPPPYLPLPSFVANPRAPAWIPSDLRQRLEEKYGTWALRRAEASLSRAATPQQIEEVTRQLYEAWTMRLPRPIGG